MEEIFYRKELHTFFCIEQQKIKISPIFQFKGCGFMYIVFGSVG